jgi:WD40 repeat protein
MDCPHGHGPMTRGQKSWMCEDCGARIPFPMDAAPAVSSVMGRLGRLPSVLALPLHEFGAEAHPVMRLHRLCDAVEILTRFSTIVALGELRMRLGAGPLPEDLLRELQPRVEYPTFGKWRGMLDAVTRACRQAGKTSPLVVHELPDFVDRHLLPALPGGEKSPPEKCLITLRNNLAHGGAMTRAEAQRFLALWEPWLEDLVRRLAFLEEVDLCHLAGGGARRLVGPDCAAGQERPVSVSLGYTVRDLGDHVVLLRGDRWVDLWPLCDYGRASLTALEGRRQASGDSPLVYIRAQSDRLLYAALGVELPQGERAEPDVVGQFRSFFQLEQRQPQPTDRLPDFEAEIRADADAFVGRAEELKQVKAAVKATASGVLWVTGPGGIGKSFLMAKAASDLCNAQGTWWIAWRFKASDLARCSRMAFLRHAVETLARKLGRADLTPGVTPEELETQLRRLLTDTAEHRLPKTGQAPRVLIVLDGLDEIERIDPAFPRLPFLLSLPGVIWLCAGRSEGALPHVFAADRCTHVFADGLPFMSPDDIRSLLIEGTLSRKYDLLRRDQEHPVPGLEKPVIVNAAVDAIVQKACIQSRDEQGEEGKKRTGGLPLYVRFVVEDILAGHLRFEDLEQKMPPSLEAYYDDLLRRLSLGDLQMILTPIIVTLAWARAPLDEATLVVVLSRRFETSTDEILKIVQQSLTALQTLLKPTAIPGGRLGYEIYHPTFRNHVRADRARCFLLTTSNARIDLCELARGWADLPRDHPALQYVLRHGPRTLIEEELWDDLEALLLDLSFLEAKANLGLAFELAMDFAEAVRWLPLQHPARRLIGLLEQSLRLDLHFLSRHPEALFQCLWNRTWWHDSPESVPPPESQSPHGRPPTGHVPTGQGSERRIGLLLEDWRRRKEEQEPGSCWLRSLLPPVDPLGTPQVAVLAGHVNSVLAVAVSADGQRIASGSSDGVLKLWDYASGRCLASVDAHEKEIRALAFLTGPAYLVTASADGLLKFWSDSDLKAVKTVELNEAGLDHLEVDRGGDRIAIGSHEGKVFVIWDVASGASILRVSTGADEASRQDYLALSPDGCLAAMPGPRGELRIIDAGSGNVRFSLAPRHVRSGGGEQLLPLDRRIRFEVIEGEVHAFDAATGEAIEDLGGLHAHFAAAAFHPDGGSIAVGVSDGRIFLHEVPSGELIQALPGDDLISVSKLAFSPDGRYLAAAGMGSSVWVWNLWRVTLIGPLTGHIRNVCDIAFAPDNRRVVTGSVDRTVRIWDVEASPVSRPTHDDARFIRTLAVSRDRSCIVSGGGDGSVRVWDARSGRLLANLSGHEAPVVCIAVSPDGRWAASGSIDQSVRVWDVRRRRLQQVIRSSPGIDLAGFASGDVVPKYLAFSPDGRAIAVASEAKTIRVWKLRRGPLARRLARIDRVLYIAASQGIADRMLSGRNRGLKNLAAPDGTFRICLPRIDNTGSETLFSTFDLDIPRLGWPPQFVLGLVNAYLGLARILHCDGRHIPFSPRSPIRRLAFLPGSRQLASFHEDYSVVIWDRVTERPTQVLLFEDAGGAILEVDLNAEGTCSVVRTVDGGIHCGPIGVGDATTGTVIDSGPVATLTGEVWWPDLRIDSDPLETWIERGPFHRLGEGSTPTRGRLIAAVPAVLKPVIFDASNGLFAGLHAGHLQIYRIQGDLA